MRRPHFLLGFDPSICSDKLNIPFNFLKHVEGRAPGTAVLVGPSVDTWHVEFILVDGGLCFNEGWPTFVSDHLLELGDSLVFRYDGDLQFTVQIFDQGMCEKETAFSAESSQIMNKFGVNIMKRRDREEFDGDIVVSALKKMKCTDMCCEITNHEDNKNMVDDYSCVHEADGNEDMSNAVTVAIPITEIPQVILDRSIRNRTPIKRDIFLSPSEAEKIALAFSSNFPTFIRVMKRFNISGSYTLHIPYQFSMAHLPVCKLKIVLRNLKGESWTVNSVPTTKVQTSHTLCGGWLSFVRDNDIGVGDICIFELVCQFGLRVRIIRVRKETTDGHDGEAARGSTTIGSPATSSKTSCRLKKRTKHDPSITEYFNSYQSDNHIIESETHKSPGSIAKHGAQTKGCMSIKSAPEEKIAAQYFVSSFPYFVRIMKQFNVSGSSTLKVPYQFSMVHLPNCKTEIVLRNVNGRCWTVNSVPTKKVQMLHTLCGGWVAFVRDNNIKEGDICIFELVGKCELCVHICGIGDKGLIFYNRTKKLPAVA